MGRLDKIVQCLSLHLSVYLMPTSISGFMFTSSWHLAPKTLSQLSLNLYSRDDYSLLPLQPPVVSIELPLVIHLFSYQKEGTHRLLAPAAELPVLSICPSVDYFQNGAGSVHTLPAPLPPTTLMKLTYMPFTLSSLAPPAHPASYSS